MVANLRVVFPGLLESEGEQYSVETIICNRWVTIIIKTMILTYVWTMSPIHHYSRISEQTANQTTAYGAEGQLMKLSRSFALNRVVIWTIIYTIM